MIATIKKTLAWLKLEFELKLNLNHLKFREGPWVWSFLCIITSKNPNPNWHRFIRDSMNEFNWIELVCIYHWIDWTQSLTKTQPNGTNNWLILSVFLQESNEEANSFLQPIVYSDLSLESAFAYLILLILSLIHSHSILLFCYFYNLVPFIIWFLFVLVNVSVAESEFVAK